MDNNLPQRKSPRANWLEYNEGVYFVTVCTKEQKHYFGEIECGEMRMSQIGRFLANELENISRHYPYVEVVQYVVMPNHFHAIIDVVGKLEKEQSSTCEQRLKRCDKGSIRTLLSSCIGGLKSAVSRYAHALGKEFAWQPRYHDHAIRGADDGNRISQYIENNVLNWKQDCFYTYGRIV